ncbi:hypothetical protein [Amycolatopsis sp. 195334CR]|uniref:hypothetical protein n=1 Tax=Amycolatopsis sp. 195334CR TaxID=2814588 RepID=UPI001A8F025E|nr:hypothetical protein [Amycolatopsis sp. 195334CR]MBN6037458.1 hypothetical protein [Amycolatopsis sp. 195334CR]
MNPLGPQAKELEAMAARAAKLTAEEVAVLRDTSKSLWLCDESGFGHAMESVGNALAVKSCQGIREAVLALLAEANQSALWATIEPAKALAARHRIGKQFTTEHYRLLTHPWRALVGPLHPADAVVSGLASAPTWSTSTPKS